MIENSLSIVGEDGKRTEVEEIAGLTVEFRGRGSTIEIGEGSVFQNSKIIIGHESHVKIDTTHARGIRNTTIDMGGQGAHKVLTIGAGTSIESCRFAMANETAVEVHLGQGCMLSSNITFRPTDGHAIFDLATGKLLNRTRPITIGDHVWLGASATVTKGSHVPSNTIVATQSLVSRRFDEQNTAIGGNPAQVIKRNIGWDRAYIGNFVESVPAPEPMSLGDADEPTSGWRFFRRSPKV